MNRKVLVIEDQRDIANLVKLHVQDLACAVELAFDGVSGLAAAEARTYDLIILDLMLPGMDGLEVCRRLRAKANYVPILIVTAKTAELDRVLGLELGADDYLTKPFSFKVLVARLRALIRRGAPERPAQLTVGSLVLDPARRTVTRRGDLIKLTAREFSLLTYLMRNAGSVVGKFAILSNVWDAAYEGSENVVEVYIGYLRKKIDAPYGLQTLSTVRGMGYRLDPDTSS